MFGKKKRADKFIDIAAHVREFLYDTQNPEAERLAVILGAVPISEEGENHERELSDKRVSRVEHLAPLVHTYAHLLSDAVVQMEQLDVDIDGEDAFPEEFWDMMRKLLEQISMSVTLGVLSQITELELIKVERK
jgi:hypothetical protein